EELLAIEKSLEVFAVEMAITPRKEVLANIQELIEKEQENNSRYTSLQDNNRFSWARGLLILFLFGVGIASWLVNRSLNRLHHDKIALEATLQDCNEYTKELENYQQQLLFLQAPDSRQVVMKGLPGHEGIVASVAYNASREKTLLNLGGLPRTQPNQQFQLWAIVEGQPISLGVFDVSGPSESNKLLLEVDFVDNPTAFAVTLEPYGGSTEPTLDKMYVLGEVG
ncbi:MAG: anti-sigma factor, partial [Bacteroidota bacterium]